MDVVEHMWADFCVHRLGGGGILAGRGAGGDHESGFRRCRAAFASTLLDSAAAPPRLGPTTAINGAQAALLLHCSLAPPSPRNNNMANLINLPNGSITDVSGVTTYVGLAKADFCSPGGMREIAIIDSSHVDPIEEQPSKTSKFNNGGSSRAEASSVKYLFGYMTRA